MTNLAAHPRLDNIQALTEASSSHFPFCNLPTFPAMLDTLIRKNSHHIWWKTPPIHAVKKYLARAFLNYLNEQFATKIVAHYLQDLDNEFSNALIQILQTDEVDAQRLIIIFIDNAAIYTKLCTLFSTLHAELLKHVTLRFIILENENCPAAMSEFYQHEIAAQTITHATIAILKQAALEISTHFGVNIDDEIITFALQLARRFLSVTNCISKTILLLDTAGARAQMRSPAKSKSTINQPLLMQIIADWTQVPFEYINPIRMHPSSIHQHFAKNLIGQIAALEQICTALIKLEPLHHTAMQPLANFLFVGRSHQGQSTAASLISQHLFAGTGEYYQTRIQPHHHSLFELLFEKHTGQTFETLECILAREPYAVILIEDIENADLQLQLELQQVLSTGKLYLQNKEIVFTQVTLILSTQCAAADLAKYNKMPTEASDLMQLMLTPQLKTVTPTADIIQHLLQLLPTQLPYLTAATINIQLHICPFLPLAAKALKDVLQKKLIDKQTHIQQMHGIELQIAPEITAFLAARAESEQGNISGVLANVDQLIALSLTQTKQSNHAGQCLLLQLNAKGDQLRSEWLSNPVTWQHSL